MASEVLHSRYVPNKSWQILSWSKDAWPLWCIWPQNGSLQIPSLQHFESHKSHCIQWWLRQRARLQKCLAPIQQRWKLKLVELVTGQLVLDWLPPTGIKVARVGGKVESSESMQRKMLGQSNKNRSTINIHFDDVFGNIEFLSDVRKAMAKIVSSSLPCGL